MKTAKLPRRTTLLKYRDFRPNILSRYLNTETGMDIEGKILGLSAHVEFHDRT